MTPAPPCTTSAHWGPAIRSGLRRDHAAPDLVEVDGLEQGLEVALAEALVALALDQLEEDRPDHVLGEDLQQQALALAGRAVDQDAVGAQAVDVLAVARQARVDAVEVGVDGVLEGDATLAHGLDGVVDVARAQRD